MLMGITVSSAAAVVLSLLVICLMAILVSFPGWFEAKVPRQGKAVAGHAGKK